MNKKFKKLLNNPKAYFKDYFSKQVRNSPNSLVSVISRALFSFSKVDFGFSKEIRSYLDTGDVELAEKKCLEALKVLPNSIKLYSMHAEVSMRQKDYDEAERRWKTVVEKFKNDPVGYEGQARLRTWCGDYDNAEILCKQGMDRFPHELWPFRVFAEISMFKKDYTQAIDRWKAVREKFPKEMAGYIRAAHAYSELEDYAHAEGLCNQALKAKNGILPYVELAEISMRQRDFQEALTRWQMVRYKFPKRAIGYIRASVAYSELDSFALAEILCKKSMEAAPNDIRSFSEYAEISMRQRDFHEALERWSAVRDKFPGKALGYIRGSVAYCQIKDFLKAEELCRKCMEIVPYDISSFSEYAEISMRKCDYKEALNRWEIVRDKFPEMTNGYLGGGKAYLDLHEYKKAEEICLQVLNKINEKTIKNRELYYCLVEINLKQTCKSKKCIELLSNLEQTYQGTITDKRYYGILTKVLTFMLGRDKEIVNTPNTDFILVRLLNEPLYCRNEQLSLFCVLNLMLSPARYPDVHTALKKHLQNLIQTSQLNNPMSVLVSEKSTDEERLNAHLAIIRNNCYHSVHFSYYHPQNTKMLEKACDVIADNGEWKSLRPNMLFNFARAFVYTNQENGDRFIAKIYDIYKDKGLHVSDPIGLLCYRHQKRQELLNHLSLTKSSENLATKELNVAVCIGGQLRGYKGNLACLVKSLGLEHHKYKVFVHTWKNIGRKFPIPGHAARMFRGEFLKTYYESFLNRANLQEYIKIQYPCFYNLMQGSSVAVKEILNDEYKTSYIVIDDEDDDRFLSWTNQEKMHYKIYAAHQLAVNSGHKFDLIIRIRPDLKREFLEIPDLIDIYNVSKSNGSVFTTSGLVSTHIVSDYIIDDNFAIGIPETMQIYANTYLDYLWHKRNSTFSRTKEFAGHTTLEHNLFCSGVHIDKLQQKVRGGFQDPEVIPINEIYDALCKDTDTGESHAEAQQLLDACKRDIDSLGK